MSLAVLAATLATVVVFFPVTFLYGVSKFLFSALALAVVISLFASYFVAMTVIPLFCARFLKRVHHAAGEPLHQAGRLQCAGSIAASSVCWTSMSAAVRGALALSGLDALLALSGLFVASLAIYPLLGVAFFPRTDAGQFTINLKVPTGTRIESHRDYVAKSGGLGPARRSIPPISR